MPDSVSANPVSPKRRSWTRRLIRVGLALLILAGAALTWQLWATRGYRDAAGVYILGGRSYVVIEPGWFGRLRVTEGAILVPKWLHYTRRDARGRITAWYRHGRLGVFLIDVEREFTLSSTSLQRCGVAMLLERRPEKGRVWDLASASVLIEEGCQSPPDFDSSLKESVEDCVEFARVLIGDVERLEGEALPNEMAVAAFAIQTGDMRVADYFRARTDGESVADCLKKITAISQDHTDIPLFHLHLAELQALSGDWRRAQATHGTWRALVGPEAGQYLEHLSRCAENAIAAARLREHSPHLFRADADSNPFYLWWDFGLLKSDEDPSLSDLDHTIESCAALLDLEILIAEVDPLVPPFGKEGYQRWASPNCLLCEVSQKTLHALAMQNLLRGDRADSLRLLASGYWFGQSLNASDGLASQLTGIAIRSIQANGLALYVLNACETEEDFSVCWDMLQRLNALERDANRGGFSLDWTPLFPCAWSFTSDFTLLSTSVVAHTHLHATDAKFQLVRMAMVARYCHTMTGSFPSAAKEFAPFIADGLPGDPFLTTGTLRFTTRASGDFAVYSVGPDEKDDVAALEYDPTNGTMSAGDISLAVPREREYPFPRDGVRVRNAYELLEIFPNGLPPDVFADHKGSPLAIVDTEKGTDHVIVFSHGPDLDQRDTGIWPPGSHTPPASGPGAAPTPRPGASYRRSLQNIHLPAPDGAGATGLRRSLQAMYDPTNGTTSRGDLFIRLPKPTGRSPRELRRLRELREEYERNKNRGPIRARVDHLELRPARTSGK